MLEDVVPSPRLQALMRGEEPPPVAERAPGSEQKQALAAHARAAHVEAAANRERPNPRSLPGDSTYQLARVKYSHEALIDVLIANPRVTQRELALHFGYSEGWLSRIMRSDAFREMVAARKSELLDPIVLQSLTQRFEALAERSAEILMEKLDASRDTETAMKALEVSSKALGFGVAKGAQVQVNTSFVVAMPQKAEDAATWVSAHRPQLPITIPAQGVAHSPQEGASDAA